MWSARIITPLAPASIMHTAAIWPKSLWLAGGQRCDQELSRGRCQVGAAWTLPAAVAARLQAETGQKFAGQPADQTDFCVRVDRARQRRAALLHASQIWPTAVLWRRLQMQGDREHLRWLVPPRG